MEGMSVSCIRVNSTLCPAYEKNKNVEKIDSVP